ncbi:MAG: dipeptide epimerase [Bellilinea sp.]
MTSSTGLRWEKIVLKLRNPFRLSYGVSETRQAFWLRLPGDEGWGEGTIPPYYGVADAAMEAVWRAAAESGRELPDNPAEIEAWVGTPGPAPARCALDLALYDRIARQHGLPLYKLLGLPKPAPMPTSFTIAIDTPAAMARMAAENRHMPIIKVKLGSDDDESRLKAIRAARPDAQLRVDANAGWSLDEAIHQVQALESYDLEMIEQPLPKEQIEAMGEVQKYTRLPLVADESVQTLQDVERLAAAGVRGINLKLMKVGGLTPGLRMLKRARELGLQVMLGCMVETSLGTTAMAHLAGLADWLDLDAPLLVSNDPFDGVTYSPTLDLSIPERPGIGVQLRNE